MRPPELAAAEGRGLARYLGGEVVEGRVEEPALERGKPEQPEQHPARDKQELDPLGVIECAAERDEHRVDLVTDAQRRTRA